MNDADLDDDFDSIINSDKETKNTNNPKVKVNNKKNIANINNKNEEHNEKNNLESKKKDDEDDLLFE